MKNRRKIQVIGSLILVLAGLLGLIGCGSPSSASDENQVEMPSQAAAEQETEVQTATEQDTAQTAGSLVYEDSMKTEYATQFAVDYYEGGYVMLTTKVDGARFLVVPENAQTPEGLDDGIIVLHRPLDHLYLVATAVMDLFRELDAIDTIRFSGQQEDGWYIEEARTAMEDGRMIYAGKYSMPDYELIVSEGCSLAIENTMITHAPEVVEKLAEFGIPTLIDYSSYETHPLGRVEWIRFYGALLGREDQADAAFAEQTQILDRMTQDDTPTGQTVAFFYMTTNGTVNVRKTSDYVPQMIGLAGGTYVFDNLGSDTDHKSSVNMTMEEFYATAKDADCLIYNSTIDGELGSVDDLVAKSAMLRDFKAVQNGNVWCTTNDMYQHTMSAGAFIEDLHAIFSGDKAHEMTYIYPLK